MEKSGPLERLQRALDQGNLTDARAALAELRRATAAELQLAAEVMHELRQPVQGLKAYVQMLRDGEPNVPIPLLLAQVERVEQIVSDFSRLASDAPAPKERVDLAACVRDAHRRFSAQADGHKLQVELELAPGLEVTANARLLEQLVVNLLVNARDAMGGRGRVKLRARAEATQTVLEVADWGPGIPPELRGRVFEPYVTSKSSGSGLGLAVCQRIAREHGAQLALAPASSFGESPPPATVFRLAFPSPSAGAQTAHRPRLLVVDDEPIIRMMFEDLMGKECAVTSTATAEEALALLNAQEYELVVCDKNLPGLSGLDLAQAARKLNPRSRIVMMTGYPSLVTAQQALELGLMDYLLKPFDDIRQVRDTLRRALTSQPAPPRSSPSANASRRVDVFEDNPASAALIRTALEQLGLEPRVHASLGVAPEERPAAVIISWDFSPARGREAVALAREVAAGAPFVVLTEHPTLESTLEALRRGAAACLPKLVSDPRALSRELARAFKLDLS